MGLNDIVYSISTVSIYKSNLLPVNQLYSHVLMKMKSLKKKKQTTQYMTQCSDACIRSQTKHFHDKSYNYVASYACITAFSRSLQTERLFILWLLWCFCAQIKSFFINCSTKSFVWILHSFPISRTLLHRMFLCEIKVFDGVKLDKNLVCSVIQQHISSH